MRRAATSHSWRDILAALAFAAFCALPALPAHAQEEMKLVEPGYLTVAVFENSLPVIAYDNQDELSGVDGEFLKSFAERHGLKIKLYKTTFASTILAVQQSKADIGTWFYYTEDRAKQVRYTLPYLRETASVFTMESLGYTGLESLADKRVAVVVGFSFAPYVQKAFKNATLFPDGITARTALLNGQVDAYVDSSFAISQPPFVGNGQVKSSVLKAGDLDLPENIAAALDFNFVACGNKGLATALDEEMKALHGNGKWDEMLKGFNLTEESKAPLDAPVQLCE